MHDQLCQSFSADGTVENKPLQTVLHTLLASPCRCPRIYKEKRLLDLSPLWVILTDTKSGALETTQNRISGIIPVAQPSRSILGRQLVKIFRKRIP